MTEKTGAKKLGKGCIEIPLEHANEFLQLFRRFRATVKIKKVIEY